MGRRCDRDSERVPCRGQLGRRCDVAVRCRLEHIAQRRPSGLPCNAVRSYEGLGTSVPSARAFDLEGIYDHMANITNARPVEAKQLAVNDQSASEASAARQA